MKEKKTVFKLFFVWDFEKEERWTVYVIRHMKI